MKVSLSLYPYVIIALVYTVELWLLILNYVVLQCSHTVCKSKIWVRNKKVIKIANSSDNFPLLSVFIFLSHCIKQLLITVGNSIDVIFFCYCSFCLSNLTAVKKLSFFLSLKCTLIALIYTYYCIEYKYVYCWCCICINFVISSYLNI